MKRYRRFINWIEWIIYEIKAQQGLDSKTISEIILEHLSTESTSKEDELKFSEFLEEKKIKYLVHFTRIENINNILKFGLIPRIYLNKKIIKLALNPTFSDNQRLDKREEVNCLSVSFPNYKMFFKKSRPPDNQDNWAVILFDLNVIRKHICEFTANNLASANTKSIEGIEGIKKMFFDSQLRERLSLPPYYPTDPQAEVLEYSVIPPDWIKEIHLKSANSLNKLPRNKKITVNKNFFRPREDYKYWKKF